MYPFHLLSTVATTTITSLAQLLTLLLVSRQIQAVLGAPVDDIVGLQNACNDAAALINASLNNSAPLNTSTLVQNIGYEVGAAQMNLPLTINASITTSSSSATSAAAVTPIPIPTTTSISSTTPFLLDTPYFNFAGSLNTLALALLQRGQAYHQETNMPVFIGIQGLASSVENYATHLRDLNLISQGAYIRTLTVENDLVEAESAWAAERNSPG